MMNEYLVTWQIDIEAESPEEAARWAQAVQRDLSSIATYFTVEDKKTGHTEVIDLEDK